jgi:hypothetical protein
VERPTLMEQATGLGTPMAGPTERQHLRLQTGTLVIAAVAVVTLLGFAFRLANFDQGLFGDELSTYWIVHGHGLGDVISSVHSNDEITPPLYFILGWLSLQLNGDPEWLRLPALLAGTATIPLVYVLGARTVGRGAGLVAAAVMALAPFMIYYSTEARAYALMIALVTASTVALLAALRTGRIRWWIVYGVCSCAALYSHYTAVFPLGAQALWVLWAHRQALRALLLANLGVLVGFAPWISGYIADTNSPTTKILSHLEPFTVDAVRLSLERWSLGYPNVGLTTIPGTIGWALIVAGVAIAATAAVSLAARRSSRSKPPFRPLRKIRPEIVLIALLALATPLGEAVYSALGTNVLGARNLNASWPGLAVAIAAVVTAVPAPISIGCATLALSGFAVGAAKTLGQDVSRPDYAGLARAIEQRWKPQDVVVDGVPFPTPVPLTGLDVYLPQTHPEFRLGLPISPDPFTFADRAPPFNFQSQEIFKRGKRHTIFLVVRPHPESTGVLEQTYAPLKANSGQAGEIYASRRGLFALKLLRRLPPGFEVIEHRKRFQGLVPFELLTIQYHRRRS